MGDDTARRELRAGFDRAPEEYQRTRPVCPPQFFDDLIARTGLHAGDPVIEVGCGTGQATVPLAERGLAVTAIELGAGLASVARSRLATFRDARVVTSSFEDWQGEGPLAHVVLAVSSLHWIDPELRYAKPHRLLRRGGFMAVGGCLWARPTTAERFWTDVQEDYRAVGYAGEPPPPPEQIGLMHFPPDAETFFEEVASMRYPFQVSYSADDYLAILSTQSGTHALGPAGSAEFISRVGRRLQSLGRPKLTVTFVGQLAIARRR
jgi:SAM-dependent methyltransferase